MKPVNFNSSLGKEMVHFVKLKQSSGSDYFSQAKLLRSFDRHLISQKHNSKVLTMTIFQSYFNTIIHVSNRVFSNYYCILQQFSAWLNQYEHNSYVLQKRQAVVPTQELLIFSPLMK